MLIMAGSGIMKNCGAKFLQGVYSTISEIEQFKAVQIFSITFVETF